MGPHPAVAEVRNAVRRILDRYAANGQPLLVACSGGADSIALASAVSFLIARGEVTAALATVDHRLQADSGARARQTAALAFELGFDPVEVLPVTVGTVGGPEAAARDARYAALEQMREGLGTGNGMILLGHTADDQAETVLLGLGRGSGIDSIAGMADRSGYLLRPLLGLRRAETRAACDALGMPVWDDPHNDDPRFRRVRLRHEVLPLLDDVLGGGVVPALARTAAQLQEARAVLEELAEELIGPPAAQDTLFVDVSVLATASPAVRTRALKLWLERSGVHGLAASHVAEADRLVTAWHGQGPIDLPGGSRISRSSGTLALAVQTSNADPISAPTDQE
jgi:tRNA(Ile)-lysidine synthase